VKKHSFQSNINFINLKFAFVSLFEGLMPLISGLTKEVKDRMIIFFLLCQDKELLPLGKMTK